MKNKTFKILLFLVGCFLLLQTSVSQTTQKKDTLYFDSDWKVTTKENHEFYRLLPLKTIDSLSLIVDYYKNGNMQMQGYAYTHNLEEFVGDIYWYDKDGYDRKFRQYINLRNIPLEYYHDNNTIWKAITYENGVKEGNVELFNNNGVSIISEKYKNGIICNDTVGTYKQDYYSGIKNKAHQINQNLPDLKGITENIYWYNGNIAKITNYKNEYTGNKIIEDKIYSKKGKLIKHLYENDFVENRLLNGEYLNFKTKNGFAIAFDTVKTTTQNSKIIKLKDINCIGVFKDDGDLSFLSKKGENKYSELDYELLFDKHLNKKMFRRIHENTVDLFTDDDLKYDYDSIIKVSDIKEQSVDDLFKTIEGKVWSTDITTGSSKKNIFFKLFNRELFSFLELEFRKSYSKHYGGYLEDDDEIDKWRLNKREIEFYEINIILLNGNKPILVLNRKDNIEYYIIPTNDGLIVRLKSNNLIKKGSNIFRDNNFLDRQILESSNSSEFYSIKIKNKKKYIANTFYETLVNKPYDSIQFLHQYIIGRRKKDIEIYNSKLEKLPIRYTIKQVYYDRENIQILTKQNGIKYFDSKGNETQRKEVLRFSTNCTPNNFSYNRIITSKKKENLNAISMGLYRSSNKILFLTNLDTLYDVTSLNKTKNRERYNSFTATHNKDNLNPTYFLLAIKNNKTGLFSYKTDVEYKRDKKDTRYEDDGNGGINIIINDTSYGSTKAEELLPVVYDNIELKDPLLIVRKAERYGIYPLKNGLKYKRFGEIQVNFMNYETMSGEKGWIDINTHKEYPNK